MARLNVLVMFMSLDYLGAMAASFAARRRSPPPSASTDDLLGSAAAAAPAAASVVPDRRRGRGATSNASGRYEPQARIPVDDGWQSLEDLPAFKTTVGIDTA